MILGADIDPDGAVEIARRSRGTPRIANRLLRRVRDVAEVEGDGRIDAEVASAGLELFGIDALGLGQGRPGDPVVAVRALRWRTGRLVHVGHRRVGADRDRRGLYEPYLIQQGLLMRTPRGRVATTAAWHHLGLVAPTSALGGADRPCSSEPRASGTFSN